MLEVVNDAFDLASNIGVTMADKMRVAKTWARVLFRLIPEERLPDVFDFAFQNHESNFAVNAYDMKQAWAALQEIEFAAREESELESLKENPVRHCKFKGEHLNDDGEVAIVDFYDTSREVVVPCRECRPKAYDAWRERYVAKNKGKTIKTIIDSSVLALPKTRGENEEIL